MTRLGTYLLKLFAAEAAALFGVALTILYLVQTLRFVDIASVRERGFFTLIWQTVLGLPQLSIAFMYVCIAIGLARALRAMQGSRELHIIHTSQRLPTLLGAIALYAAVGALLVLLLSHFIDPAARRMSSIIRAQAAADLVRTSLVPNRFAELGQGVVVTVGGRSAGGEISSFFADDNRDPKIRRTYIADSALLTADEQGYVLQLKNGTIQYRTDEGQFSEISFQRYDIALERLTGDFDTINSRGELTTWELILDSIAKGGFAVETEHRIAERTADGLRVVVLCLFVTALSGFPSGRRREPRVPMEVVVLGAVLLERMLISYVPIGGWPQALFGTIVLGVASLVALAVRLRLYAPVVREVHSA